MVLIVVVIMIFIGLVVFLLGVAQKISNEDYMEIYVNSLLVSVMRTDTGYSDSKCKLVSDLIFCAYFTPEWKCEPGVPECRELANRTVSNYMKTFANETKSLKYLFTVRPEFISRTESGEAFTLDMGDQSLKKTKSAVVYSQPLVISKDVGYNHYTLKMQLIVSSAK